MQPDALVPYEDALRSSSSTLRLHHDDGRPAIELDVERWLARADSVDRAAIASATGPVLDIGCGPGRIVEALADHRLMCLGIDISATAVAMTCERGHNALQRDIFVRVPAEGRWATAVLLDGNIGIGGDPCALLARVHDVLAPGGRVLVEADVDIWADDALIVRFLHGGAPVGPRFPWARVGVDALRRHAASTGFTITRIDHNRGRTFAELTASTTAKYPDV